MATDDEELFLDLAIHHSFSPAESWLIFVLLLNPKSNVPNRLLPLDLRALQPLFSFPPIGKHGIKHTEERCAVVWVL